MTQQKDDVPTYGLGIRHIQVTVMSIAAFTAYVLRSNLNIAIVAMVDNHDSNNTNHLAETYDWDGKIQGYILSSFYWGYITTQVPAGILTDRFGAFRFLYIALLASSILSIILPQCVYWGGWQLVCGNRVLQGISQGFVFPSLFSLLGVWAPPTERGRFASVTVSAQLLGTVAATPLSGYLISAFGWPTVFYATGGAGVVVGVVMIFFGADTPSRHRMISDAEKHYILSSLGGAKEKLQVPWKSVLTSAPYYAAMVASICQAAVYITFLTKTPTYLGTVLGFDVKENGLVSALPYLTAWILSFVFSWICDFLITRGYLRLTVARKLFNSIAHFGQTAAYILLALSQDKTTSVVCLILATGFMAGVFMGAQAGFVDLAPNFSGAIFSVVNGLSAALGLCGPIVIGYIVTETGSAEQWKIVFYICAALVGGSNVAYLIWGTSETQWWNWPEKYKDAEDYEIQKRASASLAAQSGPSSAPAATLPTAPPPQILQEREGKGRY